MTAKDADSDVSKGITDEDLELIEAFLNKSRYDRSVDDLCPSSKE